MAAQTGFEARAKKLGFDIDISSGGALMKSFTALQDRPDSVALVLQLFATKSMLRAKYFCTGALDMAKYQHYALNVPVYTHFTSPIRRYADVIVHRLLEAALTMRASALSPRRLLPRTDARTAGDAKFPIDIDGMTQIAQQCNTKKEAAKLAQEMSQHLYLCTLINDLNAQYGPVVRQAKVINVLDEAFDVLVPDFGIEKRVHIDQMPIEVRAGCRARLFGCH
jgi:protein SSD1